VGIFSNESVAAEIGSEKSSQRMSAGCPETPQRHGDRETEEKLMDDLESDKLPIYCKEGLSSQPLDVREDIKTTPKRGHNTRKPKRPQRSSETDHESDYFNSNEDEDDESDVDDENVRKFARIDGKPWLISTLYKTVDIDLFFVAC
jgi:hypothetical protein